MESESEKLRNQINMLNNERRPYSSNEDLAKSINSLIRLFAEASQEMKMDTHDAVLVGQKIDRIIDRLEKIEIQNEKIAKGIVALADMIEDINFESSSLPKQTVFSQRAQSLTDDRTPPPLPSKIIPGQAKPLPTYDISQQAEERKKPFLNFKM
jgi:DNA repair exonuclease SbcCD ATPase subunit